jgi:hypothetical protein
MGEDKARVLCQKEVVVKVNYGLYQPSMNHCLDSLRLLRFEYQTNEVLPQHLLMFQGLYGYFV